MSGKSIPSNIPSPDLVELVELAPQPMALYDKAGRLIAASAVARGDANRLGYPLENLEDVKADTNRLLNYTKLRRSGCTLVTLIFQEPLKGNEALIKSVFDACPSAILVMDTDAKVLNWNPAAERMFGYSAEEVADRMLPIVPAGDAPIFQKNRDTVLAGGTVSSLPLRRQTKDGRTIEVRLSAAPVRNSEGKVVAAVAVYEDVTALNESVRNLERSRAHLTHATRLASMGSWVLDFRDDSLTWSPETHRIHGTDPETFRPTRQSFRALVHPEDLPSLVNAVDRAQRTGEYYTVEHRLIRPDGELRHCRISAEPVKDESGKVGKLFGVVQDVTSYTQLQEQFLQAQKLETVGRLAGGVAHDFNNLLTIINGHAELLLMRLGPSSAERDSLQAIQEAGQRAASLTRQLLTLGRRQQAEYQFLDLNQTIEEGSRVIERLIGEDVVLDIGLDPSPLPVRADPGQLHQVLLNLAVNAREAMPGGGRLTIRSRRLDGGPPADLQISSKHTGGWAEFTVADTGVGIDQSVGSRVFEPFFTTKESVKHSGLGLPTVFSVLHQHGGAITFDSAPNRGTTFRAVLPLDSGGSEKVSGEAAGPGPSGARIVVVEDQPAVRTVVKAMIESFGCAADEFASPESALEFIAMEPGIDLLVTDLVMPGISGREVARRARQVHPDLPVLFMSGYAESENEPDADAGGRIDFLPKPFHPNELAARIARLLAR
ncbi:MAG TPA: PAS domain-containing protein [Bryobacteraceae bacterium]|nr:PAS domain-containing protein [Bryobacteraceae bacterium]